MVQQHGKCAPLTKQSLLLFAKPYRLPDALAQRAQAIVNNVAVGKSERRAFLRHDLFELPKLFRKPHVVLVCESYEISFAQLEGAFEILRRADVLFVLKDTNRKRRSTSKLTDALDRRVGRAVVAHNQLIGRARLRRDRSELLSNEARSVVSTHRHRKIIAGSPDRCCPFR